MVESDITWFLEGITAEVYLSLKVNGNFLHSSTLSSPSDRHNWYDIQVNYEVKVKSSRPSLRETQDIWLLGRDLNRS